MSKTEIYNVDATALFYARPQPDMGDLLTDLNTRMADMDGCHMQMSPLSHADWWLLACEKFHIMISFADSPSADPKLAEAALSPITTLRRFDYPQVVQSHRAHLGIEVGDGNAPLPPEARLIMQEFGESAVCDPDLKMKALHWTVQFVARHEGFLALRFGPSDRLFSPEEVQESAQLDIPTPLLMHPIPSLPVPGPGGVDGYALHLCNAQHLGPDSVELEGVPVAVPLKTSVALLNTLVTAHAKGKIALTHGRILQPSEKIALYVRHASIDEETGCHRIILSFWHDRGHDEPEYQPDEELADAVPEPEAAHIEASETDTTVTPRRGLNLLRGRKDTARPHSAEPTLVRTDEVSRTEAPEIYDNDTVTDIHMTHSRNGITGWLAARLRGWPLDMRVKAASLALIMGLPLLWNPYGGFTGGMSSTPGVHTAQAMSAPGAPTILALLTD